MKVGVVCWYPFPIGWAATNRILAYSKGLVQNGAYVDVYIYRPTDKYNSKSGYNSSGIIDGVHYFYPHSRNRSKYKFIRVFGYWFYYIITFRNILLNHKSEKYNFIFISNDSAIILFLFGLWARVIRAKPIFIADELPKQIRELKSTGISFWRRIQYKFVFSLIDSMIFMTEELNKFHNPENKKPSFIMSTITDYDKFGNFVVNEENRPYICYMGNMDIKKDNYDNIIKAFALITNKYPNLEFHLYGKAQKYNKDTVEQLVKELGIEGKVILKGSVSFNDVPRILGNAKVLVSSQPNTIRATGGFPTKLGEYMATGIPTLLTDVGEISRYVKNGEHVFLVPPDNPDAYAVQLDYILSNYNKILKVANNAKQLVINKFDCKIVSKGLLSFLKDQL